MTQAQDTGRRLRAGRALYRELADRLRQRIHEGEWEVGEQLPIEAALASQYQVSRATVRASLQLLENQGLTKTRHGIGTFVTPFGRELKAGLQSLQSMTDTIEAQGFSPSMDYRSVLLRPASEDECALLERPADAMVLATERAVRADEELVAFSYEVIPADLLADDFNPAQISGSLFALLETRNVLPTTAAATIHATRGEEIGWGERPTGAVYLLLEQLHYDADARPVVASRTYFLEGRFEFSILRVR